MSFVPYPFQAKDVVRIQRFGGRCLLASEVGLGKTVTSLLWAYRYLPEDPPGPVVCVVPAHLKLNWKREAAKHLDLRVEVLAGQRVPRDKLPPVDPNQIYVVNYDVLCPPRWRPRMAPPADSWLAFLEKLSPRLVIADEAHLLSNRTTMRTRAVRRLAKKAPHALLLSGTPMSNKPPSLWPLLNILRPDLFSNYEDFCQRYTNAFRAPWGWEYKGARRLDELHGLLEAHLMIRRRKADVLPDLPAVTYTVIPVEVDLGAYHRAEKDFLGWLGETDPTAARAAVGAEALTKMGHLKRLAADLKRDAVTRWVFDFLEGSDAKLLLGALHYRVTEPLMEAFRGHNPVLVDGRMSGTEKDAAFTRFNTDPACRLLVGNEEAAGTGWSCRATSHVAVVELPWRPGDLAQFVGRVHGINRGAGGGANVWVLVAADTIEADLCQVLERKQGWANAAIDGGDDASGLDIHTQVLELMKARRERRRTGGPSP